MLYRYKILRRWVEVKFFSICGCIPSGLGEVHFFHCDRIVIWRGCGSQKRWYSSWRAIQGLLHDFTLVVGENLGHLSEICHNCIIVVFDVRNRVVWTGIIDFSNFSSENIYKGTEVN